MADEFAFEEGISAEPGYRPTTRGNTRERMSDYDAAYRERPYGGRAHPPESATFDYGEGGSRYGTRREAGYVGGGESRYATRATPTAEWQQPGPYTGRGPRGYQRSNEAVTADVNERLTVHGYVDATDITVSAWQGIVTLSGEVSDRQSKRMAEDAAESVTGVLDVENRLRIAGTEYPE